jgi:hypothetical protein
MAAAARATATDRHFVSAPSQLNCRMLDWYRELGAAERRTGLLRRLGARCA